MRRDALIDKMFDVLPCSTREAIADKLSNRTRLTITVSMVDFLLTHLRSHAAEYGWTVPHVPRGINGDGGKRFFAILVNRDGTYDLDDTPENKVFLELGAASTLKHSATMLRNETSAILAAAQHVRSRNAQAEYKEIADDMAYTARKCARIIAHIGRGNGTTGP